MTDIAGVEQAIAVGDLDELLRWVDRLGDGHEWNELSELARRCQGAFERTGHQLWPAANRASYRLALEAPGRWAAEAMDAGGGRFAWGPLTEVSASTHAWAEIAPLLEPGPTASLFTHERVMRGEALDTEPGADALASVHVIDLPLRLQSWEPRYCLPVYHPDRLEDPGPTLPPMKGLHLAEAGSILVDDDTEAALRALIEPWIVGSNGAAGFTVVEGNAETAVATLLSSPHQPADVASPGSVRWADVSPAEALCHLAWAGASGGAHGRRRGCALGRFGAWWALRALSGLPDDEPLSPDELGEAADELRWALWLPDDALVGWHLHLAVEDPAEGLAWAFSAVDHA
ncbi:MAG: DUF6183 family protein [Acidimicrobiales bacterium]